MSVVQSESTVSAAKASLLALAETHACTRHPLFDQLETQRLTLEQAGRLLKNYDAHASVLRRLLLKAATFMPEPAVGFVLENVRNEYGNGNYANNHQWQLRDVAWKAGVPEAVYHGYEVEPQIKQFINKATAHYSPACGSIPDGMLKAAISAGAITATEILAIKEFRFLQKAFMPFGLEHHIWFHHVTIEAEHSDESLSLALYFVENHSAWNSIEYGFTGVLNANIDLYDGLLASIA